MSLPVCPSCGRSDTVSPDPSNGGAGRNRCRCGHTGPVRDFHQPQTPVTKFRSVSALDPVADEYEGARRPRYWWQED